MQTFSIRASLLRQCSIGSYSFKGLSNQLATSVLEGWGTFRDILCFHQHPQVNHTSLDITHQLTSQQFKASVSSAQFLPLDSLFFDFACRIEH